MPRYNVEYKGRWACFSSVTECFITEFMSKLKYEKWRKKEYGEERVPLEKANRMTIEEAVDWIALNNNKEQMFGHLVSMGLSQLEIDKLYIDAYFE